MREQLVNETAEAICSALHRTDFVLLGETDGGRSTWFTRGQKPRIIRVEVARHHKLGQVGVYLGWPNVANPELVVKGRIEMQVNTNGTPDELMEATETAVVRTLQTFRDVVAQEGVAGPLQVAP